MKSLPIGIFDSGFGGLTVMKEVSRCLPNESIIYFGDTARLPYGEKSGETVTRYASEVTQFLIEQNVKMVIAACNTACSYALEKLQQNYDVPVLGVIEPGVEKVVSETRNRRIAILGTRGTIQAGVYQRMIEERLSDANVFGLPCPLFVPLVEERMVDHMATKLIVKEYLQPLKAKKIDTVVLACTHYPLLAKAIQEELGDEVVLIDSANACAEKVQELLEESVGDGKVYKKYFVSDNPAKFQALGSLFLGEQIDHVEHVAPSSFCLV